MAIERKITGAPSPPHAVYRRPALQPREITQQEEYAHGQFGHAIGHSELDTHDVAYNHCREPQFVSYMQSLLPFQCRLTDSRKAFSHPQGCIPLTAALLPSRLGKTR